MDAILFIIIRENYRVFTYRDSPYYPGWHIVYAQSVEHSSLDFLLSFKTSSVQNNSSRQSYYTVIICVDGLFNPARSLLCQRIIIKFSHQPDRHSGNTAKPRIHLSVSSQYAYFISGNVYLATVSEIHSLVVVKVYRYYHKV